jgi:hypothetical protein
VKLGFQIQKRICKETIETHSRKKMIQEYIIVCLSPAVEINDERKIFVSLQKKKKNSYRNENQE